jgi:hypothetical protein
MKHLYVVVRTEIRLVFFLHVCGFIQKKKGGAERGNWGLALEDLSSAFAFQLLESAFQNNLITSGSSTGVINTFEMHYFYSYYP